MAAPVTDSYFVKIAIRESGSLRRNGQDYPLDDPQRYATVNTFNYLGKYQMGTAALVEAGLYSGPVYAKTQIFDDTKWTPYAISIGVTSSATFLSNSAAQEIAIRRYTDSQWNQLIAKGLDTFVGTRVDGIDITAEGILAGAHLKGAKSVGEFLRLGISGKDAYGTSVGDYIGLFQGLAPTPFVQVDNVPGAIGWALRSTSDGAAQLLNPTGFSSLAASVGETLVRNPDSGVFKLTRATGAKEYFDPISNASIYQAADGSGSLLTGPADNRIQTNFNTGGLTINTNGTFTIVPSGGGAAINLFGTSNTNLDLSNSITSTGVAIQGGGATGEGNLVLSDGGLQAYFTGAGLNGAHNIAGQITTDDWMPGAAQLSPFDFSGSVIGATGSAYASGSFDAGVAALWGAGLANLSLFSLDFLAIDPLIIDLNGDGVQLTSYRDGPVLFDIDHDSGATLEQTGWVSAADGLLVEDINGNGKIDGIHEIISEYYGGAIGSNGAGAAGTPGERRYTDAFVALKSLDTNQTGSSQNVYDSADSKWNTLRVWVDANHDGKTDSGELKTFAQLGITRITLTPTRESGLVNGGNEVVASGTARINGVDRAAQAVNLIANPIGHSFASQSGGTVVTTEGNVGTYVSLSTGGETIDLAAKGVVNATGGSGNDILTGTAAANWLAGGKGSDTFNAGAGDDVLLIDAQDLQANIHAGAGFDIAQVVGSQAGAGITLNLTQAELEVVEGGLGDDVLIGGGRSNVFIAGGGGNDIIIGGAADDALSGEDGDDLIDGGAGDDIVRGHRGRDVLLGGVGDDLIEGGDEDDRLAGGDGNDVLIGGAGDDYLDGGAGIDAAQYSVSYGDYRITQRDGVDFKRSVTLRTFHVPVCFRSGR